MKVPLDGDVVILLQKARYPVIFRILQIKDIRTANKGSGLLVRRFQGSEANERVDLHLAACQPSRSTRRRTSRQSKAEPKISWACPQP